MAVSGAGGHSCSLCGIHSLTTHACYAHKLFHAMQMERQKQQDEEWQRLEQERQQALEAKEKAERELEERKQQQSEQLATVKAKLDRLKAQKQDMVEKLKQVPIIVSPGLTVHAVMEQHPREPDNTCWSSAHRVLIIRIRSSGPE